MRITFRGKILVIIISDFVMHVHGWLSFARNCGWSSKDFNWFSNHRRKREANVVDTKLTTKSFKRLFWKSSALEDFHAWPKIISSSQISAWCSILNEEGGSQQRSLTSQCAASSWRDEGRCRVLIIMNSSVLIRFSSGVSSDRCGGKGRATRCAKNSEEYGRQQRAE